MALFSFYFSSVHFEVPPLGNRDGVKGHDHAAQNFLHHDALLDTAEVIVMNDWHS